MEVTFQIAVVLVTQILTIGIFVGYHKASMKFFESKLAVLEKKQDKHNCLVERMVAVELCAKAAHDRLDSVKRRRK